jgi:L-fuculose-phosphate aldolase
MKSAAIHPFAKRITQVCGLLYQNGFAPGRTGNVSARDEGLLWITPSGFGMREVTPDSLVQIWPNGCITADEGLAPSSELRLHQKIYEVRPDAGAVVHAHPPKSTALAVLHQALDQPILSEIVSTLREVPLVPFHAPGSRELADAAARQLERHDAVLLANHGVVAIGKTPEDALANLELVESFAEIYLLARQAGPMQMLTPEQIAGMHKAD